jgi:hypothetical protein
MTIISDSRQAGKAVNRKYAPHNRELERLEKEAREAKRGLWSDSHAIPPWEFESNAEENPALLRVTNRVEPSFLYTQGEIGGGAVSKLRTFSCQSVWSLTYAPTCPVLEPILPCWRRYSFWMNLGAYGK